MRRRRKHLTRLAVRFEASRLNPRRWPWVALLLLLAFDLLLLVLLIKGEIR